MFALALATVPTAVARPAARASQSDVTVSGSKWVDTGVDVRAGDQLHITASGTVTMGNNTGVTADGAARGWMDTLRALMVPSAGRGALVGRIGDSDAATPFLVGADGKVAAPVAGRLYLAINQDSTQTPEGTFKVHIAVTASTTVASTANYDFQPLFARLDQRLPYRVTDQPSAGNPGDLVNFVLIGSASQVTATLKAAGWLQADKTEKDAVLSALLATLARNTYTAVPMSMLYLFGRSQDYGYERAEPVMVAAQRNHFRIWQAPWSTPQQTVWVGAGTHDVGIEHDQRTPSGITHRIDQDVDNERDFIGATLQQAGQVEAMSYMTRAHPITTATTATGGEMKSDGRVLVIVLKPQTSASR